MKMRNKGKVHPFTTSSSSSSSSSPPPPNTESLSVLKLLPAAILTLVSVLSLEDSEVVAYMITRSLKSTNNEDKKRCSKKQCSGGHNSPALFDCDCFHCYTSFWLRWDSSPNGELITQAIEAFDDHLNAGDNFKNHKIKRRDKLGRRKTDKILHDAIVPPPENQESHVSAAAPEVDEVVEPGLGGVNAEEVAEEESATATVVQTTSHKGLARKMLPDFMGIFHWRYWSLWSPNVFE